MSDTHRMLITTEFDGDIMWTWMDGVYAWYDGKYTHRITLAQTMQNIEDMCEAWHKAIELHVYIRDVFPQLLKEIGDISFTERAAYIGG